jgi:hypothetical protein
LDAIKDDLGDVMKGAAVVISCVGIPFDSAVGSCAKEGLARLRRGGCSVDGYDAIMAVVAK